MLYSRCLVLDQSSIPIWNTCFYRIQIAPFRQSIRAKSCKESQPESIIHSGVRASNLILTGHQESRENCFAKDPLDGVGCKNAHFDCKTASIAATRSAYSNGSSSRRQ